MSGAGSRYDANSQGPGRRLAKRVPYIGSIRLIEVGRVLPTRLADAQLKEGYRVAALVHSLTEDSSTKLTSPNAEA